MLKFIREKINSPKIAVFVFCITFSSLVYSCANMFVSGDTHVDPKLIPYVNTYMHYIDMTCPKGLPNPPEKYTIKIVKESFFKTSWVGVCRPKLNGFEVEIKEEFWNDMEGIDYIKQQLINHELAHCFLGKNHIKDPNNYMNPSIEYLSPRAVLGQTILDIKQYCERYK